MKKHGNIKMEVDGVRFVVCMNNADFENKLVNDNIVLGFFYYLSEIIIHTSNLKDTILVRTHRPSK